MVFIESEDDGKSKVENLIESFKKLIKKLKDTIDECIQKIKDKFKGPQGSSAGFVPLDKALDKLEEQLAEAKELGCKEVKFVDIEKGNDILQDFIERMNKKIETYFKKYIAFGNPYDGEKFLKQYEKEWDDTYEGYHDAMTEEITISITEAMSLCEKLKDTNSKLSKSMEKTKDMLDTLERECRGIERGINDMDNLVYIRKMRQA